MSDEPAGGAPAPVPPAAAGDVLLPPPRRFAWRLIVAGLLLFVTGALCGGFVALRVAHRAVGAAFRNPNFVVERMVYEAAREVGIDADQQLKLRAILLRRQEALTSIRREVRDRIDSVVAASDKEIETVLKPDQVSRWRDLSLRMRRRWRPSFGKGGGPHQGPPGPPPGPLPQ